MYFDPVVLDSVKPQDIDTIIKKIAQLNRKNTDTAIDTTVLKSLFASILKYKKKVTVMVQEYYIDRVYRDCYYNYYSGKHFSQSRYCSRIFIFSSDQTIAIKNWNKEKLNESYIGCCVVRPTQQGIIGRSLLNPNFLYPKSKASTGKHFIRLSEYNTLLHGTDLTIKAFPYMMQDAESMACAEVSISLVMDYYSNRYADYRSILPSDIYSVSRQHGYERVLPTHGMAGTMIARVLTKFGFHPRQYITGKTFTSSQQKKILHYYVESAIPVIVESERSDHQLHSVVCIGHKEMHPDDICKTLCSVSSTDRQIEPPDPAIAEADPSRFYFADTADACDTYIVMDDGEEPYCEYKFTPDVSPPLQQNYQFGDCRINSLIIPLYKRMFMEAEDAFDICREVIVDRSLSITEAYKDFKKNSEKAPLGSKDNPLILRLFMASSRSFKEFRCSRFHKKNSLNYIYQDTPVPKFVWVCELFDQDHYQDKKVIGEIVLDATSTPNAKLNSIIMINYMHWVFARHYNGRAYIKEDPDVGNGEQKPEDPNGTTIAMYKKTNWEPYECYQSNLTAAEYC